MTRNRFHVDENSPWLKPESGWPDEVPRQLDPDERPLYEVLSDSCRTHSARRVIWFEPLGAEMSYDELLKAVDAVAAGLHLRGIRKGDTVALMLPNSPQYIVAYYACQRIGAIVTGVNPIYKPQEVLHQLKTTHAKALIVLDALYEAQVAPIWDKSDCALLVTTNVLDMIKGHFLTKLLGKLLGKVPTGTVPAAAHPFKLLLSTCEAPPEVPISCHDTAVYLMTGGTTGVPKAAVLTHFNCVNNAKQCTHWIYNISAGTAYVGILPLYHAFAMSTFMNTMLRSGGFAMLFPRPPKTEVLIEKLIAVGPKEGTVYCGAEVLFKRMADFLEDPANRERYGAALKGKLTLCISGASALHRSVQESFEKHTGARLSEGYGLTECSPVVSCAPFWGKRSIGTIGLPFPGTEWRIVDRMAPTKHLGYGEENTGELAVAGPGVMKEYLDRPEETADTLIELDGKTWVLTGDIGYMDEFGRVVILDRKKQLIKYKGMSVFPKEVEELISGHEAVSEAAVAGLPDDTFGEIIKVWVVLKADFKDTLTEAGLKAWCEENMAHYKVPKLVEFRDEIPKNLIGKVLRRELQEKDPIWIAAKQKRNSP